MRSRWTHRNICHKRKLNRHPINLAEWTLQNFGHAWPKAAKFRLVVIQLMWTVQTISDRLFYTFNFPFRIAGIIVVLLPLYIQRPKRFSFSAYSEAILTMSALLFRKYAFWACCFFATAVIGAILYFVPFLPYIGQSLSDATGLILWTATWGLSQRCRGSAGLTMGDPR